MRMYENLPLKCLLPTVWSTACFCTLDSAGADRELQTVRQMMIDFLQNHSQESKPPACPPLDPVL